MIFMTGKGRKRESTKVGKCFGKVTNVSIRRKSEGKRERVKYKAPAINSKDKRGPVKSFRK